MPTRMLRDGILTSPRIAKLGWAEEVFYRRLMSVVDDYGRYYADPGMLRAACYPRQLSKVADSDIGKWTRDLAKAGLVRVYPASDGESYLELLDFRQQVRAKSSKFPDPLSTCVADAKHPLANVYLDVVVGEGVSVGVDEGARKLMEPTDEHRSQATALGIDCVVEFAKYRDYLLQSGRKHVNESAGFRNWIRKAAEFKRSGKLETVHDRRATVAAGHFKGQTDEQPTDITGQSERVA